MTMDLQQATETIYESGVAGDLTDEPAMVLLQWGEAQLPLLMAKDSDDAEAFEADFEMLRRIMKGVNRIIARASDYSTEQLETRMGKVMEWAQELGLPATPDALPGYIEGFDKMDEKAQVTGIVAILSPPPAPEEAETETETPAETAIVEATETSDHADVTDDAATTDTTETPDADA